jgi:hypothetical protein
VVDQAQAIVTAVEELPDDLDHEVRSEAVATLVGYAADHDAKGLRVLGRRILEVVAPQVGEADEARLLAAEERETEATASFRMSDDGHGKCHGRFTIPALHGAMLKKALLAYAAPKHRTSVDGQASEPGRPSAHRLGEALVEYLETYPVDRLPTTGGVSATVVVTMPVDTLMGGLKAAQLDTGHRISPGLARRLACRAGMIPAVLGSQSQVLDLGGGSGSTTNPSGSRWPSSKAPAPPRAATGHRACATPTTTPPGTTAAPPASRTADSSAPATTPTPTTPPTTPPSSPAARSGSTDERDLFGFRGSLAQAGDEKVRSAR